MNMNSNTNLSPALSQGVKFKKHQNKKYKKNLEKQFKEGFENIQDMENNLNLSPNGLTVQSINIIENNNYSSQQQTIANLKQEYATTLNEYETLVSQISSSTMNYLNRINPTNPYLGKNVCLTNGACGYVTQQGVFKLYNSSIYTSTAGFNGCPNTAYEQINGTGDVNTVGSIISSNPPLIVGTPMVSGQSCGNEGNNVFVNSMIDTPATNYVGCYADNVTSPLMTFIGGSPPSTNTSTSSGSYTYEQCQNAAINSGYQYFALQNVNVANSQGYCAVSNSQSGSTSLGEGMALNGQVVLWSSNTASTDAGYTALLTNVGSLSVHNTTGTSIFSTPNSNAQPSNYLGCYGDNSVRAMTMYNKGSPRYNYTQCQQIALQNKATYFGLQNSTSGKNAQCSISSNLSQTTQYGTAGNCTKLSNGSWSGGGWSNAVYNTSVPNSNYYLILQDDGNMCIYRGSNPNDNQGNIWCSNTAGQQQQPNPTYVAQNGKYGQNWISSGATLASGDFVGSTNGNMALIMQPDGNLVLYTFNLISNCQKMADGNMGGGIGANALYNNVEVGIQSNMGQLSYIDQNAELHPYPSTNIQYSNTYTELTGTDSSGNNISGAEYDNATVESCQTTCNNNPDCAGFSFTNNICYPKTSGMYPTGSTQSNPLVNLYVREKMPISTPIGVSNKVNNTNSVTYNNYINGGSLGNNYGLTNGTSVQKQQLSQLQTKLNALSREITGLTNKFETGTQQAETQSQSNVTGIKTYLQGIEKANNKITNFDNNVEQILNDSDIVVLQKNYDYLFWSILATGAVLITMNTIKL